ncbi:MAG: phosphoribosylanthranilate isomerase [SAR324 cluster bacterium]|uniref:N-(5'-phosphoribosyl)anthranilate isomerase n=1 Tax=SAR324 cluster bacterium TaxID=2024889 RepID=A0A2A4SWU8_9DELT|nr:MAG: phosphoribosylanthranilate isomerase [SAR324 cluster bacterium]
MSPVKIKVCGLTQKEQALEIASMGVDALGFILYPPSPRYIEPERIKPILEALPPLVKTVGVFVDEAVEEVVRISQQTGLDLVQLHGKETPAYCRELTRQGVSWIKAFRVKEELDQELLAAYQCPSFLLDAWSKQGYGGTGETFNWDLAKPAVEKFQILLAGGITPENVQAAIHQIQPYGIDLSSGVELSPGIKSMPKIRQLLSNIAALS